MIEKEWTIWLKMELDQQVVVEIEEWVSCGSEVVP